jgi:hypothetical protein
MPRAAGSETPIAENSRDFSEEAPDQGKRAAIGPLVGPPSGRVAPDQPTWEVRMSIPDPFPPEPPVPEPRPEPSPPPIPEPAPVRQPALEVLR